MSEFPFYCGDVHEPGVEPRRPLGLRILRTQRRSIFVQARACRLAQVRVLAGVAGCLSVRGGEQDAPGRFDCGTRRALRGRLLLGLRRFGLRELHHLMEDIVRDGGFDPDNSVPGILLKRLTKARKGGSATKYVAAKAKRAAKRAAKLALKRLPEEVSP